MAGRHESASSTRITILGFLLAIEWVWKVGQVYAIFEQNIFIIIIIIIIIIISFVFAKLYTFRRKFLENLLLFFRV